MDFAAVLTRITEYLEDRKQPTALIGGVALAALGFPRTTLDLDLLVPADAQDGLIDFMESTGYETLHRSSGYSNHAHQDPQFGQVDFVYVGQETSQAIFAAAQSMAGPGSYPVRVPRPEHLIAMKVLAIKNDPARRLRELADIERLLSLPDVDREQVRESFERHGLLLLWGEFERP